MIFTGVKFHKNVKTKFKNKIEFDTKFEGYH
jgi:hypothetical protein